MASKNSLNTPKLKRQLQVKSARRRSTNVAAARVEDARHEVGRNDLQPALDTVLLPIDEPKPNPNRTRVTTPQLLESVTRSIKKFGIVLPLLIDKDSTIVAGHALWEAARGLGFEKIECRVVDHLDPLEREALSLALNRIGEIGEYDLVKLRERMIEIRSGGIELISTGFVVPEIDQILAFDPTDYDHEDEEEDEEGETPEPVISRLGDLFQLGEHSVLCGDARLKESYSRVLKGRTAHCVFSDPPYGLKIEGFVSGLGQHKHADFVMFAGQESDDELAGLFTTFLGHCRTMTSAGAVIFACMDHRKIDVLLRSGIEAGLSRYSMAVWNKGSGGMGGLYRQAFELVAIFCNGNSPATNHVRLGVHGRDRTSVWTYPGANRRGTSAAEALADHPTPKPVELVCDALLDVTDPGDIVLDPFLGGGVTVIAAEQCDRICCSIELDPKYIDRSIRRWERLTGREAVHVETGLTFSKLAASRRLDGQE